MADAQERLQRETLALSHQGLDIPAFFDRLRVVLGQQVDFAGCCWMTFDPATILPTGHIPYRSISPEQVPRLAENEYFEDDVNKFSVLALDPTHAATLRAATGGHPEDSTRFRVLLEPNGFHDELRVAFERDGLCWGGVALYRREPVAYTPADVTSLASVAGLVADGVRRAILTAAVGDDEAAPDAPGLVLLTAGNRVDAVSPAAERWMGDLFVETEADTAGELVSVVHAVASHARRAGGGDVEAGPAIARARTRSGRWLVLHGSLLDGDPDGRVAVIIEPARPPQIAPLVAMAYGLTTRERDVTRLVIQGHSTAEIAEALFLSPHTVQDHLKAVFDKVGVRSRREMVSQVFAEHYAPRMQAGAAVGADGWFTE
jgi:DNA-binding CsgD family transcriptional regulator